MAQEKKRYYIDKESFLNDCFCSHEIPPTYFETLEEAQKEFNKIVCDFGEAYSLWVENEAGECLLIDTKSDNQEF